ncbi:MAG: non-ribosomal peptide synthetase, partial [Acidobacteria bacterium]|nr:non-ribosomal peptide synthetase [Acidobacteriota bacterium]
MIEHGSLVNLCFWHNAYYSVTSKDRATKYAGFSFDASIWEFFPYLVAGASICMVPEEIALDIEVLNNYYEKQGVSISFLPTPICEQFLTLDNNSLRLLLTGGDKFQNYLKTNYQLYNNYGPTESTVVTTSYRVTADAGNIPIGKPVANTQVYILDSDNYLQPVGVAGELCISGDGLARGYLNNPELTNDKFILPSAIRGTFEKAPAGSDPQKLLIINHSIITTHHSPIYKTGDLARWLPDGNIEFLGRIDHQVKIRGYRIETGEIENCLLKHPGIREAVVLLKEDAESDKYLAAYFVSDLELSEAELREHLLSDLPDYMIPAYFTQLKKIPQLPSGKIDRNALPKLQIKVSETYAAPRHEIEKKLVKIYAEVLGRDEGHVSQMQLSLGIDDNFFQLGGHSLKATILVSKIHKILNVHVPLAEVFK